MSSHEKILEGLKKKEESIKVDEKVSFDTLEVIADLFFAHKVVDYNERYDGFDYKFNDGSVLTLNKNRSWSIKEGKAFKALKEGAQEGLVDHKAKEVKPGDIVQFRGISLGSGKKEGQIRVEKIDGDRVTYTVWDGKGGKEKAIISSRKLSGYITKI